MIALVLAGLAHAGGACDLEPVPDGAVAAQWEACEGGSCEELVVAEHVLPPLGVHVHGTTGRVGAAAVSADRRMRFVAVDAEGGVLAAVQVGAGFPEQCVARTAGLTTEALWVHIREGDVDRLVAVPLDGGAPRETYRDDTPAHWEFVPSDTGLRALRGAGPELVELVGEDVRSLWSIEGRGSAPRGRPSTAGDVVVMTTSEREAVVLTPQRPPEHLGDAVDAGTDGESLVWTDDRSGELYTRAVQEPGAGRALGPAPLAHRGVEAWTVRGPWAVRAADRRDEALLVHLDTGVRYVVAGPLYRAVSLGDDTVWVVPAEGGVRRLALP